jgi:hypothetical protein
VGWRRPAAVGGGSTSVVSVVTGTWPASWWARTVLAPTSAVKRRLGPLTGGLGPVKNPSQYLKSFQILKLYLNTFPWSKNLHTLHDAGFEYKEQLSVMAQL